MPVELNIYAIVALGLVLLVTIPSIFPKHLEAFLSWFSKAKFPPTNGLSDEEDINWSPEVPNDFVAGDPRR